MPFDYSDDTALKVILTALSRERLDKYVMEAGGDARKAASLYCWNISLSAAFFGPLGVVEVVLRNALHKELSILFGESWFDEPKFLTIDQKVAESIAQAKASVVRDGKQLIPPRVVAELSLGFWVNLMRGGKYTTTLWGPALVRAFPKGTKRADVMARLNPVHKFRNRVAHHEPIFHKNPQQRYDDLIYLVTLLAPALVEWIEHHSRVPHVIGTDKYTSFCEF